MSYELIVSLRLLLSTLLGGVIGLERESLNKSAGLRTYTLVSLGSCLIMITSIEMYKIFGHGSGGDPARLAAQVVSGIGFLGAGAILHSGFNVRGLTTAASLWVVAGIGLAVGAGRYLTAVVTTVIVFFVLMYMPRLENYIHKTHKQLKQIVVCIDDKPGQLGLVSSALGSMKIQINNVEMESTSNENQINIIFEVVIPWNVQTDDIIENINIIQGVYNVSVN